MIVFDNEFYYLCLDGLVEKVELEEIMLFVIVMFFEKEMSYMVECLMNCEEVEVLLYELMLSKNLFYGIWMDGMFCEVRMRIVLR